MMNTNWIMNLFNLLFLIIFFICSLPVVLLQPENLNHVDYGDTPEIIESRGFKCETHHIVTSDGYILKHFRIINPLNPNQGRPLILQSGLFGSSDEFLINSPNGFVDLTMLKLRLEYQSINYNKFGNNLGFLLANLGYDVWLTNFRGNYYSNNHTTLDPNSPEFWSTGWDEMATIDLPETIDYVLNETQKGNLGYIGMSRGSGIMFALLSEKPEYSEKVKPFIGMAPGVFVQRFDISFLRKVIETSMLSNLLLDYPGECFSRGTSQKLLSFCSKPGFRFICSGARQPLKLVLSPRIDNSRMEVYFSHYPSGSPCWDLIHYAQIGLTNEFRKLDFGQRRNLLKYGTQHPPTYHLDKIKSQDIIIISSIGDSVITPENVARIVSHLRVQLKELIVINEKNFNHDAFVYGKDAGELVYKSIIRVLAQY